MIVEKDLRNKIDLIYYLV